MFDGVVTSDTKTVPAVYGTCKVHFNLCFWNLFHLHVTCIELRMIKLVVVLYIVYNKIITEKKTLCLLRVR